MAKVIVTTEGTDEGVDAIRTALALLGTDHEFVFLTVGDPPMALTGIASGGDVPGMPVVPDAGMVVEMTHEAEVAASRGLDHVMDRLGVSGRRRVEVGDPGTTIVEVAVDEDADLIVVGATKAGVVRRLLGGSVADQVAHHAPCPVLITRPGHTESPSAGPTG